MSNIQLSTTVVREKRGPGRKPHYGERQVQTSVRFPPVLMRQLRAEAAWRCAREGDPDSWSISRVIADILFDHFGIERPGGNGHD